MSVGDSLKSVFLYGLPMGNLSVVGLRPKWRSNFSRACLYIVCECGRQPKIATFVLTSYWENVGSRDKAKIASEFSRTCLYSVCECGRQPKIATFVWTSYGEVVGSLVKVKMAIAFFSCMPIQRM